MADDTEALTDETLAQRVQGGDRGAFALLFDRYKFKLVALMRKKLRREDADDLVQTAFFDVWVAIVTGRYDARRRFKPFLFRVAINKARDRLRRIYVEKEGEQELQGRVGAAGGKAADPGMLSIVENLEKASNCWSKLKHLQQRMLRLRYPELGKLDTPETWGELYVPEVAEVEWKVIAKVLGMAEKTTRARGAEAMRAFFGVSDLK